MAIFSMHLDVRFGVPSAVKRASTVGVPALAIGVLAHLDQPILLQVGVGIAGMIFAAVMRPTGPSVEPVESGTISQLASMIEPGNNSTG